MKRYLACLCWLLIPVMLAPAAFADEQVEIPEFVSFSENRFALVETVEYEPCYKYSYECAYNEEARGDWYSYIDDYYDALTDNGDFTALGEHHADYGRFGEYTQDAVWFAYNGNADLSAFTMNLVDVQTGACHVLLAIKDFEEQDKFVLEVFASREIALVEVAEQVPTFEFVPVPVETEVEAEAESVLLAEALDASSMQNAITADNALIQDMVAYLDGGYFSYDPISSSGNYNVRNFNGKKSDFSVIQAYVDMLVETNPYLTLLDPHYEDYGSEAFFSFGINYTGNVNLGSRREQTFTDNECDVLIYGTIKREQLKFHIWTPQNMELTDLGYRYGGDKADTSIGGESALAGLVRLADGSFQTTDGRLTTKLNQAAILRDGELYTTEATFERNEDAGRDRVWARYFYRNETVHFSYATRSLITGDVLCLADMMHESSWLIRDNGDLEKENGFTAYRWDIPFLGVNHDGNWVTPINDPDSYYSDATVRVMYADSEVAVYYVYAQFKTAPYEIEALIAVQTNAELSAEDQADFTTYAGQMLSVDFSGRQFGAKYELFEWEIISGGSLATLSDTKSATCTVHANKAGAVGLRCTYEYGVEEPNVLTGNPTTVNKTKTYDVTIIIK